MVMINFDARNVSADSPYDVVPSGWYEVEIVDSKEKQTNSGNGSYIELTLEIMGPTHKGRKIWDRLNLDNPNPKAVEIAQRTLSQICNAVGQLTVTDTTELHHKPMVAAVRVRPESEKYAASNEVKNYKALNKQQATGAEPSSDAPPAAASNGSPSSGGAPPWAR